VIPLQLLKSNELRLLESFGIQESDAFLRATIAKGFSNLTTTLRKAYHGLIQNFQG